MIVTEMSEKWAAAERKFCRPLALAPARDRTCSGMFTATMLYSGDRVAERQPREGSSHHSLFLFGKENRETSGTSERSGGGGPTSKQIPAIRDHSLARGMSPGSCCVRKRPESCCRLRCIPPAVRGVRPAGTRKRVPRQHAQAKQTRRVMLLIWHYVNFAVSQLQMSRGNVLPEETLAPT